MSRRDSGGATEKHSVRTGPFIVHRSVRPKTPGRAISSRRQYRAVRVRARARVTSIVYEYNLIFPVRNPFVANQLFSWFSIKQKKKIQLSPFGFRSHTFRSADKVTHTNPCRQVRRTWEFHYNTHTLSVDLPTCFTPYLELSIWRTWVFLFFFFFLFYDCCLQLPIPLRVTKSLFFCKIVLFLYY